MRYWKRASEFACPLLLMPIAFLDRIDTNGYEFSWYMLKSPLSSYWVLILTGVAWIAAVLILRPLSATGLSPRMRFSFIAALLGAWLAAIFTIQINRTPDAQGNYTKIDLVALLPAVILTWGIRERLSPTVVTDTTRCPSCRYSRTGLPLSAPCPECGRAAPASSPNNPT